MLKRVKYCLRGLALARSSQAWFALLQNHRLADVVRLHPKLFHKLQRPYLHRRLRVRQRLAALQQHYHFVATRFSPALIKNIYRPAGLRLATLPGDRAGDFELRLSCSHLEKEGDLVISLWHRNSGLDAFTLAFSITRYETGGKELFIGGLQGHKSAGKNLMVAITRSLHGLRPKALLLFTLQQLAAEWGITRLRAVSDATHIYRHFQKRRVLSASYDEFWEEAGGRRDAGGIFELPATFTPREISAIKPNKRQLYKRRYEMLAQLEREIRSQVALENGSENFPDQATTQPEYFAGSTRRGYAPDEIIMSAN